jgi:tRNA pseudouridine65 synthase
MAAMTGSPELPQSWRDEHLVVVCKPAGWLVHRTGQDAHEDRFVLQTLRDQLGQPVYPVHRLDKGTSGVLLMALHPQAARLLTAQWQSGTVDKRYVAMVRGWPPFACSVDHALRPDDAPPDAPAQPARTVLRRLATLQLPVPVDRYPHTRVALVEASPLTGRRHQIRRHLKHLAHPIVGDATHGKGAINRWWAAELGVNRLWLHAAALRFRHPVTDAPLLCEAPWQGPQASIWSPDWVRLLDPAARPWAWEPTPYCKVDELGGVSVPLVNNSAASTGSNT